MTNAQEKFSGSGPVREGQGFDTSRLAEWMARNIEGFSGPLTVEQFKGGQSNPTYKLITPKHQYVMRRKPSGKLLKGAHAIEREFRVIHALRNTGFPVARAHALCEDETIVGTAFYLMDMVEGRIFWNAALPDIAREERPFYFDAMNEAMAHLHRLDPDAIGLGEFGRPENYIDRQIKRWSRQYEEDEMAGRLKDMDMLVEWLPENIPSGDESSIVHGDFRIDNMIWHATEPKILAVLDWELSTLGHPLADFAYHLLMYALPPHIIGGIKGLDIEALNIPPQSEYGKSYCQRTGRRNIEGLNFYLAFNLFRFGAIIHGIKGRMARGTAASPEARTLVETLPELAGLARAMAER